MERHTSQKRQHVPGRAHGLGRRMGTGLLGLLLLTAVAGCGGHEASDDAVVIMPSDSEWGTLSPSSGPWQPTTPILIKVQKSADDPTPIPGADITIQVGGVSVTGTSLYMSDGVTVAGAGGRWTTTTDEYGVVVVVPEATALSACPAGATDDINGSLSVGAWISSHAATWSASFSIGCS